MSRVKSLVSAGLIAGALLGGTIGGASASHGVVSGEANAHACFGQARAVDASDPAFQPIGEIFSARGAANAGMNRAFLEACQPEAPEPLVVRKAGENPLEY